MKSFRLFLLCFAVLALPACLASNDDDATANDDDSGDDDDATGDDDDAAAPLLSLLDWAEAIAPALRTSELHDFLQTSFDAASNASCPGVANNSAPPPPSWYPAAPSQALAPWAYQVPSLMDWSGSCSSSVATWTGSATDGAMTFSPTSGGCVSSTGNCSHSGDWWEGSSLGTDAVPGQVAGSAGLSLDGLVYTIDDSWSDGSGCDNYQWEDNLWRGATAATIVMAPGGADAPTLLAEGVNELDWAWETENTKYIFPGGLIGCFPGEVSSLAATVVWYAATTPRTMVANLNWSFALGGQVGPSQFVGPAGCDLEPMSGTLTLTDRPSPGAPPIATFLVTFDGATICDGCASLRFNGTPAGPWCPAGGFASP